MQQHQHEQANRPIASDKCRPKIGRAQLLDCAGGNRQLLKQLVHRLRQKVEDDTAAPRLIKTVPNAGYSIDPGGAPNELDG